MYSPGFERLAKMNGALIKPEHDNYISYCGVLLEKQYNVYDVIPGKVKRKGKAVFKIR